MGLGSYPSVTLADVRGKARAERAKLEQGADPIQLRQSAQRAVASERSAQQTFTTVAAQYIALHAKSWKNSKHAAQWVSTLHAYAEPVIGPLCVRDINATHIISVLEPIWTSKTETATRVRSRVELVLDFAAARGLREGPDPARWRGNLDAVFPKTSKIAKVQRHTAVGVDDICTFVGRLGLQQGLGAGAGGETSMRSGSC